MVSLVRSYQSYLSGVAVRVSPLPVTWEGHFALLCCSFPVVFRGPVPPTVTSQGRTDSVSSSPPTALLPPRPLCRYVLITWMDGDLSLGSAALCVSSEFEIR